MTRDELIAALQMMPENDVVVLDLYGRFSTDYQPERRLITRQFFDKLTNVESDVNPKPKLGEWIILL